MFVCVHESASLCVFMKLSVCACKWLRVRVNATVFVCTNSRTTDVCAFSVVRSCSLSTFIFLAPIYSPLCLCHMSDARSSLWWRIVVQTRGESPLPNANGRREHPPTHLHQQTRAKRKLDIFEPKPWNSAAVSTCRWRNDSSTITLAPTGKDVCLVKGGSSSPSITCASTHSCWAKKPKWRCVGPT